VPPALRTAVATTGASAVVRPCGELDIATADELVRTLSTVAGAGPARVVVDLSSLAFVDVVGLHALLDGARAVRAAGGELVLTSPPRMLRRMLDVLDLHGALPVEAAQNSVGVPDSIPRSSS
jgi:anti-sigma B factor antagonist